MCQGTRDQRKTLDNDDTLDRDGADDRRLDTRLFVNAPAEITNLCEPENNPKELVIIENVSDVGCRFSMHGPVRERDTIAIQLLDWDGKRMREVPIKFFEVKWVTRGIEISVVGARSIGGDKLAACRLEMKNRASLNPDHQM